jgi:chromosome segregation ATPase
MEPKLGAPQTCPVCGGSNPSGLSLPKQCVWCKKKITMSRENIDVVINDLEANIAWLKKEAELHELAMQQNKDRMQDLEEENAALRQRNAELVEALKGAQSALYWLFSLKQIKDKEGKTKHYRKYKPIVWKDAEKAENKVRITLNNQPQPYDRKEMQ